MSTLFQLGFNAVRPVFAGLLAAVTFLAACTEPDLILPGERQELRSILQDVDPVVPQENVTRPLRIPAAKSNSEWSQFWGSPAFRTTHPAFSANPRLIWSADIGAGDSRKQRITADPVVGGGTVFTLDASATVSATSADGSRLWQRDLAPANDSRDAVSGGGLSYSDGRVYVTLTYGSLTVLDARDGSTIWTQDLESTGSGAVTVAGGLVYLTSGDSTAWALDAATGRVRWQIGGPESVTNVLGAPAPVVSNDLAIFSFGSGDVEALFRRGGLQRWTTSVVGERRGFALSEIGDITGAPVISGNRIFVGNQSGRLVALDLGNGSRAWTADEGTVGPVWPVGDSVFFISDRNQLMRLSAGDGGRIWGVDLPLFTKDRPRKRGEVFAHYGPVLAGGRLIVVSNDGMMRSFDPTSGALLASMEIPGGATTAPAFSGGTMYVVNTRGQLLAFR